MTSQIVDTVYAWGRYYSEAVPDSNDLFWGVPTLVQGFGTGGGLGAVQLIDGEAAYWLVLIGGVPYGLGDNQYNCMAQASDPYYTIPKIIASTNVSGYGSGFSWSALTGGSPIVHLEGGDKANWALDANGHCWGWGNASNGCLGNNNTFQNGNGTVPQMTQAVPQQVLGVGGVGVLVANGQPFGITAGQTHFVALMSDSTVVACGTDEFGECGDNVNFPNGAGSTPPTNATGSPANFPYNATPVRVVTGAQNDSSGFLTSIGKISAGNHHTLALTLDGMHIYAWGHNGFGQCGDGTTNHRNKPVEVPIAAAGATMPIVDISGGGGIISTDGQSLCIDSKGVVWGWGANTYGQLGTGTRNGQDYTSGYLTPKKLNLANNGAVLPILIARSGTRHGMCLDSANQVFVWGSNQFGAVGIPGMQTGNGNAGNNSGNTSVPTLLNGGGNPGLDPTLTISQIWAANNTSMVVANGLQQVADAFVPWEIEYAIKAKAGLGNTTATAVQAANQLAGTKNLDLLGALNFLAGNAKPKYKGLAGVLNQLAGTVNLEAQAAASIWAGGPA